MSQLEIIGVIIIFIILISHNIYILKEMKDRKRVISFNEFEKNVMTKFLDGEDDVLSVLREQYHNAIVKNREFTGKGFFTDYIIPNDIPKLKSQKSFQIGDVIGEIDRVEHGIGFVLFIKNGVIDVLEGFTYGDEEWPNLIINYKLSYLPDNVRDIKKLSRDWE